MRWIVITLIAALVGCASYETRREQEPWLSFVAAKTMQEFAGCAIPKIRPMFPTLGGTPEGDGMIYADTVGHQQIVLIMIKMVPAGDATEVELRSMSQTGNFRKAAEALQACRSE